MKKFKIEFGFGIGEDKNRKPIPLGKREAALNQITMKAASRFGGYTVYRTYGGWINGLSDLVEEPGITLLTHVEGKTKQAIAQRVTDFAAVIREILNQETVCVSISPVDMRFV